jgi:uncharacterized membrane protein YfcA
LSGVFERSWLWLLLVPSVLGGLMGALLLTCTSDRNFIQLVPWPVLIATVIILLRPILARRTDDRVHPQLSTALWPVAIAGIFLVAVYGGYFGAGIGILMIGALTFISPADIRHVAYRRRIGCGSEAASAFLTYRPGHRFFSQKGNHRLRQNRNVYS